MILENQHNTPKNCYKLPSQWMRRSKLFDLNILLNVHHSLDYVTLSLKPHTNHLINVPRAANGWILGGEGWRIAEGNFMHPWALAKVMWKKWPQILISRGSPWQHFHMQLFLLFLSIRFLAKDRALVLHTEYFNWTFNNNNNSCSSLYFLTSSQ